MPPARSRAHAARAPQATRSHSPWLGRVGLGRLARFLDLSLVHVFVHTFTHTAHSVSTVQHSPAQPSPARHGRYCIHFMAYITRIAYATTDKTYATCTASMTCNALLRNIRDAQYVSHVRNGETVNEDTQKSEFESNMFLSVRVDFP